MGSILSQRLGCDDYLNAGYGTDGVYQLEHQMEPCTMLIVICLSMVVDGPRLLERIRTITIEGKQPPQSLQLMPVLETLLVLQSICKS